MCVGLQSRDRVLDQKTIWKYRDQLARVGASDALFDTFKDQLRDCGYHLQTETLVDSTMVHVPRQRNSREDNSAVKNGRILGRGVKHMTTKTMLRLTRRRN
ncbi:MAG: hypothetical protein OXC02_11230 [Rhodobacteraceae bacterium]|nr:hypothetical protein [Paracoccaceae bacterium]